MADLERRRKLNARILKVFAGVFTVVLIGMCTAILVTTDVEPEDDGPPPTPTADSRVACLQDIDCVVDKSGWKIDAQLACKPHIEDAALYAVNWTDGWGESIFNRAALQPPDFDNIKYSGSKVRFQNVFGVWLPMQYQCVYDPINEVVLSVDAYRR